MDGIRESFQLLDLLSLTFQNIFQALLQGWSPPPHGSITVLYHHHHHFTCPSEPCISWWPGPPRRKSYEGRNVKIVFPLTFDYRTEIIHYLCIIVFSLCYAPKTTNILCATPTHPFNGSFSRTTWVSQYQKGKPIWILLKQETVSGSGISWAICKSAHRSRQITMPAPHHSFFYRPDALPAAQLTASKHWRHVLHQTLLKKESTVHRNCC